MQIILIKENVGIPKYRQIVKSIENAIKDGIFVKGSKLPSVNSICKKHGISRDTVFVAYNQLKTRGIIQSISGKGYYVKSTDLNLEQKIFVLFDELNAFKEDLYNSFLKNIGNYSQVDIYFHHFNYDVFSKLIFDSIGNYNHYVIMPANLKNTDLIIGKLPKDKVYILDQMHDELAEYRAVCQNFESDMYSNLTIGITSLKKYNKLILLFQNKQPLGMLNGFVKFCKDYKFEYEILNSLEDSVPKKGEVYIIPDDRNLIVIMKKIKEEVLLLGQNIGIISYNDTLLKEILEGGITTISTDFKKMGEQLAKMILTNEKIQIENCSSFIKRNSL
jgi:DNA-binding transcriptional regulator YhcF (GntR family)